MQAGSAWHAGCNTNSANFVERLGHSSATFERGRTLGGGGGAHGFEGGARHVLARLPLSLLRLQVVVPAACLEEKQGASS